MPVQVKVTIDVWVPNDGDMPRKTQSEVTLLRDGKVHVAGISFVARDLLHACALLEKDND